MTMWVFAYGSLLWDPGFAPAECVLATLGGHARSFCMRSVHHRGTHDDPGLVLALDVAEAASCRGVALRVAEADEAQVLADLRARELISSAYEERQVELALDDGRAVTALAYVINRDHAQYCGALTLEEQAQIMATAVGGRGPNSEYLHRTTEKLTSLDIADPDLAWLSERVRELTD
ncbi:gamma-glutamylcyclotransferase [Pseudaestuariivita sp.]|uniref:gamma-glutamylcyclotransferase n=1 Tax=Pseudaestuariivita sp. TaxID=2211669 RepID=UPI00405889FC